MSHILGTFKLDKNENLDNFYAAAGVPWIARKMMLASSPTIFVTKEDPKAKSAESESSDGGGDEGEAGEGAPVGPSGPIFLIKTVTFTRTIEISFELDKPFEEEMASGDIYNTVAKKEGENKLILESTSEVKDNFTREYEFSGDGLIMTLKLMKDPVVEAKRYFKRI